MPSPRVFTVEEIDELIPELSHRVQRQLTLGVEIETLVKRLSRETGAPVSSLEPEPNEPAERAVIRSRLREHVQAYEKGWRDIQGLGAVVKDTSMGLLDFYGRLEGRLVWLCWRFGEDRLGWYHELDTGFSGRRALTEDTRERVLN
ncbi:MAG TPA: DUF2203 domain-containing protein [Polyangiaceae bacterium]|nr:DUF2203 domain-containing protein [Polyangiaceae bacterium]